MRIGRLGGLPPHGHLWTPKDHGLLTWAFDPIVSAGGTTALATAGTMYLIKLHVPRLVSVTNIVTFLQAGGSSLTSGQCFAALYQGGARLGVTADQATAWATALLKTMPISGGPVTVQPGDVYVGLWFNGTTGPAPLRALSGSAVNLGLAAADSRWGTANTGLTTTAPASLGAVTGAVNAYWAGLS